MKPKVISIVGRSGSGKTTLLTQILPHFKQLGLKVGTIKHTHHEVVSDHPGKDSWKHRQSGSEQVLLVTGKNLTLHTEKQADEGINELVEKWFNGFDLVLSEGFKNEPCLKIEVSRKANSKSPLCTDPAFKIAAVVSDYPIQTEAAQFQMGEIEVLVNWISKRLDL
jgi:molybdopterin-guanine dinucleotide biosynthesis protein MobB